MRGLAPRTPRPPVPRPGPDPDPGVGPWPLPAAPREEAVLGEGRRAGGPAEGRDEEEVDEGGGVVPGPRIWDIAGVWGEGVAAARALLVGLGGSRVAVVVGAVGVGEWEGEAASGVRVTERGESSCGTVWKEKGEPEEGELVAVGTRMGVS